MAALFDPAADTWTPSDMIRRAPQMPVVPRRSEPTSKQRAQLIVAECAAELGLSVAAFCKEKRYAVARARQKAMWRVRCEVWPSRGGAKTARLFGCDSKTVLYGIGAHALRHGLPAPDSAKRMAMRLRRVG